jgi:hypothetical protein
MLAATLALVLCCQPFDKAQGKSDPAPDADFLRRLTLDLAGTIPTSDQARAFLSDPDPAKRERLIDRLIASPDYARRMEQAVTVMFLERRGGGKIPDAQWSDYLRKAFASNEPWDKIVRAMIASDGRADETRPAMKLLADGAGGEPNRMTQDISRLFLGRNLLCAQCHDHPTVKDYKQADYMGLFAFLNQSKLQDDPKTKKPILVEGVAAGKVEFASVFSPANKKQTGPRLPGGEEVDVPKFEKGKEYEKAPTKEVPGVPKFRPRELLADDLVRHPQFARNSANRFWFIFLGKGIIHPLDLDHRANPPSDPALMDDLTKSFVDSGFDVRALVRRIVTSPQYADGGKAAPSKPLSAEQLAWATLQATGTLERSLKGPIPEGSKFSVKEYLNGKKAEPPASLPDIVKLYVDVFGNAAGEPEVGFQPSMTHALFLMNDRLVLDWVRPREGNLVSRLSALTGDALAEELYLCVLTRKPDADERRRVAVHLERNPSRRDAALGELVWALIASTEFRMNH